eukprot:1065155-Prymnesium_polylepis.2
MNVLAARSPDGAPRGMRPTAGPGDRVAEGAHALEYTDSAVEYQPLFLPRGKRAAVPPASPTPAPAGPFSTDAHTCADATGLTTRRFISQYLPLMETGNCSKVTRGRTTVDEISSRLSTEHTQYRRGPAVGEPECITLLHRT